MSQNRIAHFLKKPAEEITKQDLMLFIEENDIEAVNFRHAGGDGRLKTLNFVITDRSRLDRLLSVGERVDGSSLFPFLDAASSDLYVVPRYRTAFVNPFENTPTLDVLCSYYTSDGEPLPSSPENVVRKAQESLDVATGMTLEAMGELEYYVVSKRSRLYPAAAQEGYQESPPFCKWEAIRREAMRAIAVVGGKIKYGHSEVGHIVDGDREFEQHEIEFHTRLVRDGRNMMVDGGDLSDAARKAIAGYLRLAPSLTAFGNTVPLSFLRLVPHQEAPTKICWVERHFHCS